MLVHLLKPSTPWHTTRVRVPHGWGHQHIALRDARLSPNLYHIFSGYIEGYDLVSLKSAKSSISQVGNWKS